MLETLERGILDPITEQPPYGLTANRPLEFTGKRAPSPEGHGIFLVDHQYPRPEMKTTYASSRDSEGEKRFDKPKPGNRKIPIKVYITEAQGVGAATNLFTNPGGEKAIKYSAAVTETFGITRELGTADVPAACGEYRDKHAFDGAGGDSSLGYFNFTFPAAGTYVVSLFVWIPASWDGGSLYLITSGDFAGSAESVLREADLNQRGEWQRISSKITVAGGDLTGFFHLRAKTKNPSSIPTGVVYSDALQIESGSAATAFLWGDTPGCYWNGKPHESTSTRVGTGSDKKRTVRCLYDIQEKIEKLADEGGTYKRILPNGEWMVFDVEEASFVGEWMKQFNQGQQEFSFELICKPGARLAPITLAAREEKTLPLMVFTETDIPGNLSALGDLLIEDIQGVDRNFVAVAVASRFLDTSANAEWFYQAEARLRLAGATIEGAAVKTSLFEEFTPLLSTRSEAGVYTTHVGAHKVFARIRRPTGNTGDFYAKLEYSQGDLLRWRSLPSVSILGGAYEGEWIWLDLGVVRLNQATVGTQRWEGRISMKSTVLGDTAEVDSLVILPVEENYSEISALTIPSSPVGPQVARDTFSAASGALTGDAATVGGNWALAGGDADDFTAVEESGGKYATRQPAAVDGSGANNGPPSAFHTVEGRYLRLGAGTQAGVSVSCDIAVPMSPEFLSSSGVIARYVDMNNMAMARLLLDYSSGGNFWLHLQMHRKKAGAWLQKASKTITEGLYWGNPVNITLYIAPDGSGYAQLLAGSSQVGYISWGPDADLGEAGALKTGGYGIYHAVNKHPKSILSSPIYPWHRPVFDNFIVRQAPTTPIDAALYANKDLRVRWDKALREAWDVSTVFSTAAHRGDRLFIPNSGREQRPVRIGVFTSRGVPNLQPDPQADDTKATLTVTPRVTEVPEAV